jgi:hypothetical protein
MSVYDIDNVLLVDFCVELKVSPPSAGLLVVVD